jgi:hypothetical protein
MNRSSYIFFCLFLTFFGSGVGWAVAVSLDSGGAEPSVPRYEHTLSLGKGDPHTFARLSPAVYVLDIGEPQISYMVALHRPFSEKDSHGNDGRLALFDYSPGDIQGWHIAWNADATVDPGEDDFITVASSSIETRLFEDPIATDATGPEASDRSSRRMPAPESATMLLLGAGLLGIATIGRNRLIKR